MGGIPGARALRAVKHVRPDGRLNIRAQWAVEHLGVKRILLFWVEAEVLDGFGDFAARD